MLNSFRNIDRLRLMIEKDTNGPAFYSALKNNSYGGVTL